MAIYVVSTIEGKEIRTVLNDDCFFSDCPVCGEQTKVDSEQFSQILSDGEVTETSVYCDKCAEEYHKPKHKLTRIK